MTIHKKWKSETDTWERRHGEFIVCGPETVTFSAVNEILRLFIVSPNELNAKGDPAAVSTDSPSPNAHVRRIYRRIPVVFIRSSELKIAQPSRETVGSGLSSALDLLGRKLCTLSSSINKFSTSLLSVNDSFSRHHSNRIIFLGMASRSPPPNMSRDSDVLITLSMLVPASPLKPSAFHFSRKNIAYH